MEQVEAAEVLPAFGSFDIREKDKEKKRAAEVVRIKLTTEARLLMVAGEQCSADNDWLAVRLAWKEASRVTEAFIMPGETAGVIIYEVSMYQTALSYRGDELSEMYMDLLRNLEASAKTMSMKRRVKRR